MNSAIETNSIKIIKTDAAPAAIGTYSQAVAVPAEATTTWISGQIPLDPDSMELVEGGFEAQCHQVFRNLAAVAQAAGGELTDFVKLNVYLTDLADFAVLNGIMEEWIKPPFPARAAVQVAALPRGARIEIDAVMVSVP